MKNIHVLPTNKPSKLATHYEKMRLIQTPDMWTYEFTKQNIYITNSEEIKEGDWILVPSTDGETYFDFSNSFPKKAKSNYASNNFVFKIILTTDQDLIKDGVQAIKDEFLEWFVKNPSCEEVEVESGLFFHAEGADIRYKIIIPKKEPISFESFDKEKSVVITTMGQKLVRELQSTTQEETIEKIAENESEYLADWEDKDMYKRGFVDGAKWQAKRMYSEEEVVKLLIKFNQEIQEVENVREWFEEFKKK